MCFGSPDPRGLPTRAPVGFSYEATDQEQLRGAVW